MNEDRLDDLASLFLPDILHLVPSRVKQEGFLDSRRTSLVDQNGDTPASPGVGSSSFIPGNGKTISGGNSLTNFNFASPTPDGMHLPYATFLPFEGAMLPHQYGHHHVQLHGHHHNPYPPAPQYYSNGQQQGQNNQQSNQQQQQYMNYLSAPSNPVQAYSLHSDFKHQQHQLLYSQNHPQQPLHYSASTTNFLAQVQGFSKSPNNELNWTPNQLDILQTRTNSPFPIESAAATVTAPSEVNSTPAGEAIPLELESGQKEKKRKVRRSRELSDSELDIDYRPSKLKSLLDFKVDTEGVPKFKIVEEDGNEVKIEFNGFLNGRFLTNDIDNTNYMFTKSELSKSEGSPESDAQSEGGRTDPKVISCYRRNYIQISLNMKISGFNGTNKLLKLTTDEYGYPVTRVIKYFKIEISASTNMSNSRNVPIFIKQVSKDKEKEFPAGTASKGFDIVQTAHISTPEHVVPLNDDTPLEENGIDKYFVVKKLQFKNATPNNGNLTFQNYYHLRMKLTAVVADLYYDDYEGEYPEKKAGSNGTDNNEITLFELVSEPIIVRGRNPNFYSERKDILIKGRLSTSKKSFKHEVEDTHDAEEEQEDLEYLKPIKSEHSEAPEEDVVPSTQEVKVENQEYNQVGAQEAVQDEDQEESQDAPEEVEVGTISEHSSGRNSAPPQDFNTANKITIELNSGKRYKYFPISSVYYLPPINVVYFPHGAHQSSDQRVGSWVEPVVHDGRKSSNVYFKS